MKKKAVSGIMLAVLFLGMLTVAFGIKPVIVDARELEESGIRVISHKITRFEWDELKKKVGVWEEDEDFNKVIDGHGTGVRPPTKEGWMKILKDAYVADEVLWRNQAASSPSSVDHTSSSWFPPIGNQDGEGSCVAWAVGYYVKTFEEAKEHGWDLSGAVWEGGYKGHPTQAYQDQIFSPDFIYHQTNGGEDQGSYFYDAINLVCLIGACTWEEMPYDPDDHVSWPSELAWREAPLYRGDSTGIQYMWINTNNDVNELKNWVASDHLAMISIDASEYSHLTSDDVWTLDNYAGGGGHANIIAGYDDNLEYLEEGEIRQGAFKIANSWGEGGWEDISDGCYWISYEAMKQRIGYCMFYHDRIGYEPELVTAFRIDHSKRGECDITIGMGNKDTPFQTKRFDNWLLDGGNNPFGSNNIVLDITEFKDAVPTVVNQLFFTKVYDGGTATIGTIDSFSIEYYSNYLSRTLYANSTSHDVPVSTVDGDYAFAELILRTLTGDVAVTNVFPSKTKVGQGHSLDINVTAENQGVATETFDVTAYASSTDSGDNFNDDSTDFTLWKKFEKNDGTIQETNGRIECTVTTAPPSGACGYITKKPYDLSDCDIQMDVSNRRLCEAALVITLEGTEEHFWYINNFYSIQKHRWDNTCNIKRRTAGGERIYLYSEEWSGPVGSLRIRIHDGIIYFYEENHLRYSEPFTLSSYNCYIHFEVDSWGGSELFGTDYFDNFKFVNHKPIDTKTITLPGGDSTTIPFAWNTTDYFKGNYTISAYAWPVPGEADTADNLCVDGVVQVVSETKLDTAIEFTFSPNPANPGQAVTLSGTLEDVGDSPVYPAQVKVEYKGRTLWTLPTNAAGQFSKTFKAPKVGSYPVSVSYAGSASYNPSSDTETLIVQTGGKVDTELVFSLSPNPANPGQAVTLSGTLKDVGGNPVYPAQVKVEYSLNGVTWKHIWTLLTSVAGQFSKTFKAPKAGTYYVKVSYAGSASYNPSSHTETLNVQP